MNVRAKSGGVWGISDWLAWSGERLSRSATPRLDAEVLLAHTTGRDRAWLYAHGDDPVNDSAAAAFHELIQGRSNGEPVAYLTGTREFWSLSLQVTPDVLIPRPETELLVELALAHIPQGQSYRVADLGTGSGCLALAMASERPRARVLATDISSDCLRVAEDNARQLGLNNIEFRHGDWFQPLVEECFDLIVSNPPYVATNDPHLSQGDVRFEPRNALAAGADGLDAIRLIVDRAKHYLTRGGWLLLEHGWNQGDAVSELLRMNGYRNSSVHYDPAGKPRVAMARVGNVL